MNSNSVLTFHFMCRPSKVLIYKFIQINILDFSILVLKELKEEWWTIHSFYGYEYSIIVNSISKYLCKMHLSYMLCQDYQSLPQIWPTWSQNNLLNIYFSRYTSKEYGLCFQWTRIATGRQLMVNALQKSWHFQNARIMKGWLHGLEYTAINRLVLCYELPRSFIHSFSMLCHLPSNTGKVTQQIVVNFDNFISEPSSEIGKLVSY